MKKNQKDKIAKVTKLLENQKIRNVKELDSYKLSICHPASAGIDLGSREIYVAINPQIAAELDLPIVHSFSTYTSGLEACRDLLLNSGVTTVAMESTSVYWMNLCDILEAAGMEVVWSTLKSSAWFPDVKRMSWTASGCRRSTCTDFFRVPLSPKDISASYAVTCVNVRISFKTVHAMCNACRKR